MKGEAEEEARRRALKFLGYRARSAAEVRRKLAQLGFSRKIIDATVERLLSVKILDDERFAETWAAARVEDRGYGPLRIERELREKGIENSLITRIVDDTFGRREEFEGAKALLKRKFKAQDLTDGKVSRRAIALLQRRGYNDSVIARLFEQTDEYSSRR